MLIDLFFSLFPCSKALLENRYIETEIQREYFRR
jgi:hypothetical protein